MIELRGYQLEAVELAMQHAGYLIGLEQRTGKTAVAVEIVRRRLPAELLIVCPKVAVETVWEPVVGPLTALGIDVHIWNYEQVVIHRRKWRKFAPEMVICDEVHWIKGNDSQRSRALRSIGKTSKWRLGLTGTPLESGLEDAWAQFAFLDPELFGDWKWFKTYHLVYGGFKKKKIVGYMHVEEFTEKVHSRMYRKLLEEVQPEKTKIRIARIRFPLRESAQLYQEMLDEFIVNLNAETRIVAPRVITQTMKLHQITGGHIIDENKVAHRVGGEKLWALRRLLSTVVIPPVVVYVRFIWELEEVSKLLEEVFHWKVTRISGSYPFKGFTTDAAVIQVRSGVAIDLSRATVGIIYSMDHSHLTHEQARFRIRSYDGLEARYYYLLALNTIDEDIYEALVAKRSLSSAICDKYRKSA